MTKYIANSSGFKINEKFSEMSITFEYRLIGVDAGCGLLARYAAEKIVCRPNENRNPQSA